MDKHSLLTSARVAVLASVRPDGRSHAVPIVFAVDAEYLYTAVDHKPKSTGRLARLENIAAHPQVSVLVQHYSNDWEKLWWVRVDGLATVIESPNHRQTALDLLTAKYPQYQEHPPAGAVIAIRIESVTGWAASPSVDSRPT